MHIEYRISERDYKSAATLAQRKQSSMTALDHYFPYLFSVAWVIAGFIPSAASNSLDPTDATDLIFELGVIPVLLGFLWKRKVRLRKEYEKANNLHLLQQLDLDSSGLRLVTSMATARTSWQVYTKFTENETVFLLFQEGKEGFLAITKSFLTPLQTDELRTLLAANLPKA
jgi:hypothetical protein